MKSILFLTITLLLTSALYSQERGIRISNPQLNTSTFIKEFKRIRIKTNGRKISGRFKMKDDQTILIKDMEIKLEQIEKIKRNPLLMNLATGYFLGSFGASLFVGGIFLGIYSVALLVVGDSFGTIAGSILLAGSIVITGSGSLVILAAIKSPNILRGYKRVNAWEYRLVGF